MHFPPPKVLLHHFFEVVAPRAEANRERYFDLHSGANNPKPSPRWTWKRRTLTHDGDFTITNKNRARLHRLVVSACRWGHSAHQSINGVVLVRDGVIHGEYVLLILGHSHSRFSSHCSRVAECQEPGNLNMTFGSRIDCFGSTDGSPG